MLYRQWEGPKFCFPVTQKPLLGQGLLIIEASRRWVINVKQKPPPDNRKHSQKTDFEDTGGIRTCNYRKRREADPRLGLRGHWDQRSTNTHYNKVGWNPDLVWTLPRHENSLITVGYQNSVPSLCSAVLHFPGSTGPVRLPCRHVTLNVYVLTFRNINVWILRWNEMTNYFGSFGIFNEIT